MTLALLSNTTAIGINLTTSFVATGGTAPYAYSVVPGGVGGSIDTQGFYTSPASTGKDIVQVRDSTGEMARLDVSVGNALELFCDVIQTELGLSEGRVYLWDQKIMSPKDSGIFIPVSVISCKPFSNSKRVDDGIATQSTNFLASLSVDIVSRGPEARDRKEEIILALGSDYAESQQELNNFYIGRISNAFVNLSEIDGAAIPYRFNISVNLQYSIKKTKAVPYYDSFQTPVTTTDP